MDEKLSTENLNSLKEQINKMDPVDLANKFEDMPIEDIIVYVKLLNKDLLADTFAELKRDDKIRLIQSFSDEKIISLIQELDEHELVDTIQELPANMVRKIMKHLEDDSRRPIINKLLGYPQESIGSIMSVNFISVKITDEYSKIMNKIYTSDLDAKNLEQIWLTDESLVLIGYIYLADLLRYKDKSLEELSKPLTATVLANDDQEVAAKLAHKYDLAEIPVTDSEGRLIGIITVEQAIDVLYDEYSEDLANIHGITESDSDEYYLDKSSFKVAKNRTTWLVICLLTATLTGFIIQKYEAVISASVLLTAYIPMLMDSGGNAGTQASTTIIKSLYAGEIGYKDAFKVLFKEFKIGLLTGLALVVVNFFRMLIIDHSTLPILFTVSITLLITIIISKVIGGILPLISDKLNIDPTVMAGPIITTIVDTLVLLIYFEVASLLIGL